MKTVPPDHDWEERLQSGLGSAPAPDFATWCDRHSATLEAPRPTVRMAPAESEPKRLFFGRNKMSIVKVIAASIALVGGIAWLGSDSETLAPSAFADAIPGVDNVKAMTWTETYYMRLTSKDGKKSWITKERRLFAYRSPGYYRETMLGTNGEVIGVHVTDQQSGRMLRLVTKEKQATLESSSSRRDSAGPFTWVGDVIRKRKNGEYTRVKSLSLQGQKELDDETVNVVAAVLQEVSTGKTTRVDIFFDTQSKRLAGMWAPNEADLNFESLETDRSEVGVRWKMEAIGALIHEINLDPQLDAADFSLDPPAGYALEKIATPTVSEDEMVAFLGATARFNDNQFPDSPFPGYDREKLNAAWELEESARTAEANQLIALIDKIRFREIYEPAVRRFVDDHTAPESFVYVGSGVNVGQADRMVCWYQYRGARTYRAVFGDLTVKNVKEADLPLNLLK